MFEVFLWIQLHRQHYNKSQWLLCTFAQYLFTKSVFFLWKPIRIVYSTCTMVVGSTFIQITFVPPPPQKKVCPCCKVHCNNEYEHLFISYPHCACVINIHWCTLNWVCRHYVLYRTVAQWTIKYETTHS